MGRSWRVWGAMGLALSWGCPPEPPPTDTPPPAESDCDLTFDTLADKTFIRQTEAKEAGKFEDDTWARARFYKEGDVIKAKYNTRTLTDMYTYTCGVDGKEMHCFEDNPDARTFCQTLRANEQPCTVEEVVRLTGLKADAIKDVVATVNKEVDGLNEEQSANLRKQLNNPNNQLRGIFHVKIKKDECRLSLEDNYQTYNLGALREMGNFVGTARFVKSDRDLVFENCKDSTNLVALNAPDAWVKPGETQLGWKKSDPVPYRYVGEDQLKAEAGCTYKQDTWAEYEAIGKNVPVDVDAKGRLNWSFSHAFQTPGKKVVHQYRYKTCGDKTDMIGVSCQGVIVGE